MHVAVTGATGLVGANLVAALNQAGHAVRATRRASSDTSTLDDMKVEWVNSAVCAAGVLIGVVTHGWGFAFMSLSAALGWACAGHYKTELEGTGRSVK